VKRGICNESNDSGTQLINFAVHQHISVGRQDSHLPCGCSHKFNETRKSEGGQSRKVDVFGTPL
jgi:hypothetical protein